LKTEQYEVSYYLNVTTKANQKHLFHFTSPLGGHCIGGVITYLNLVSYYFGPLYTRSKGPCSTQIKHSYWCQSWNQPQGLYTRSNSWTRKNLSIYPKVYDFYEMGSCSSIKVPCIWLGEVSQPWKHPPHGNLSHEIEIC
jgi:hypothetical protein